MNIVIYLGLTHGDLEARNQIIEQPAVLMEESVRPIRKCVVTKWSPWGPCNTTGPCKSGYQFKFREIKVENKTTLLYLVVMCIYYNNNRRIQRTVGRNVRRSCERRENVAVAATKTPITNRKQPAGWARTKRTQIVSSLTVSWVIGMGIRRVAQHVVRASRYAADAFWYILRAREKRAVRERKQHRARFPSHVIKYYY